MHTSVAGMVVGTKDEGTMRLRGSGRWPAVTGAGARWARRLAAALIVAPVFVLPAAAQPPQRSTKAEGTRLLLDRLAEREMPDVVLWVLDRIDKDPAAPADLKAEAAYRRAVALVGMSRRESDAAKRAGMLDNAEKQIDAFLASSPSGPRAVEAFTQRGNLLIERGRAKLAEARRPGADVKALRAQAVPFFDAAIKSLQGTVEPGKPLPEKITNAEDAVLRELRAVSAEIDSLEGSDAPEESGDAKPRSRQRPRRATAADTRRLNDLKAAEENWQGRLVQTRLMVASAWYEKAQAFDPKSDDWKKALEESTKRFKTLVEKYPTLGGGFFARYYQGRNQCLLGQHDAAVATLTPLTALQGASPLVATLRRKAQATIFEAWLAAKKFAELDADLRKQALTTLPVERLDEDWLALKLRAALLLEGQAMAIAEKDRKTKGRPLLQDAKRMATDVVRANREFAAEARELLGRIGASAPDIADDERTFQTAMDDARVAMTEMQEAAVAAKAEADAAKKKTLLETVAAARGRAIEAARQALRLAGDAEVDAVNQARYLLTYLFYDAGRFHESATLGRFLAERYPNARGSRQAATIAMASWQQLQRQTDPAWRAGARDQGSRMAERILTIWPSDNEAGDAALVALLTAVEERDPARIIELVGKVPEGSPRRPEVMLRAGTALWREVLEQRRGEGGDAAAAEAWKKQAVAYLDAALAAMAAAGPVSRTTVAGALTRAQIALDDGDTKLALRWLEDPRLGPWTVANDAKADAAVREGPFAEVALTTALRCFVEAESLDKAQQAMDRLEKLAGDGEESSARLTAMYFAMGRELQQELETLAKGAEAGTGAAGDRARAILAGFEKFLDGVQKRDAKVSSQIWVASTYLTLGSGGGTSAIVPKPKAQEYLDRAGTVFEGLIARKDDPEIAKYEPAIRLKMADISLARGRWQEAESQINWLLADKKRQNTPDLQITAAEILQAAGRQLAGSDPAAAEDRFRQAAIGWTSGESVVWGWGGIANRVSRLAFGGDDDRAKRAREQFFQARLELAACLFARANLSSKSASEKTEMFDKAIESILTTRRLHPDLGGKAGQDRFEQLLKAIQKQRSPGVPPRGFAEFEEARAAAAGRPDVQAR